MDSWAELSWGQKASSLVMLLFAAFFVAIPVLQGLVNPADFSPTLFLNALTLSSLISAVVLNPKHILGNVRAMEWKSMPRRSQVLYMVAGCSVFASALLRLLRDLVGAA